MAQEIELKLALPVSARRALLRHPMLRQAVITPPTRRLYNIYFDTPEHELRQNGIALRLRRQGRQWLQTVKCAGESTGGLSSRPEWEGPYDGHAFDFSAVDRPEVRKRLERLRDRGSLVAVFETDFQRRSWHFETAPGSRVILAYDCGEIRANGRTEAISEVELEIAEGGTAPLLALARELASRVHLRPDNRSKAERGFALGCDTPLVPCQFNPPRLTADENPRAAFRKLALACLAQIQGNEQGVLRSDDPEFIHQMRVGLRRLRSALKSFQATLPAEFPVTFGDPLREFARHLGSARDRDVLVTDVIQPVSAAFPGDTRLAALIALAESERCRARSDAVAAVGGAAYGRLMLDLLAALHDQEFDLGDTSLQDFAGDSLLTARKQLLRRAREAETLAPPALHALRIAVKRLRYLLGFFPTLLPAKRHRQEAAQLSDLQADLGRINDLTNARTLLLPHSSSDATLAEALALVEGWHRGHMNPLWLALPGRLAELARQTKSRKRNVSATKGA